MILVTGGCGFIGCHLVKALRDNHEDVRVLDNCSRGKWENIRDDFKIEFFRGDVRNIADVDYVMRMNDVDEVIHLAYINGTRTFYEKPDLVLDVAVKGITNIIDACKKHNVRRLTLASSSEVCRAKLVDVGEAIPLVIPDPFNPRYSYSAGKIISEMMAIHAKHFERLLIFRPFNIYGPKMTEGHVIPDFIQQFKKLDGKDPATFKILGNGDETRSFCYIDDLIDGVMLMREKGSHHGIYNIGVPIETSIRELALRINKIMRGEKPLAIEEAGELREGDAPRRRPDISKLAALGYHPKVCLDDGLRRVIDEMSVVR